VDDYEPELKKEDVRGKEDDRRAMKEAMKEDERKAMEDIERVPK
jgi:hypothetical protein